MTHGNIIKSTEWRVLLIPFLFAMQGQLVAGGETALGSSVFAPDIVRESSIGNRVDDLYASSDSIDFAEAGDSGDPRFSLITYNRELTTWLSADGAQFELFDWDDDGRPDIIGARQRRGLHWHRNAPEIGVGYFDPLLSPAPRYAGAPAGKSWILDDRRMGRGFTIFRMKDDDGPVWVASVEQFTHPREIGTRRLRLHMWRRSPDGWDYVEPIDESGGHFAIGGDIWMGPVLEAADWTGNGKVDLLVGGMVVSKAFPESQYPSGHRFAADSFDYEAGRVYLLENVSRKDGEVRFAEPKVLRSGTGPIRGRGWTYPRAVDLTGNGVLDLVIGDNRPGIRAILNKGTTEAPELVEFGYLADEYGNPIMSTTAILPVFGDIDGDGKLDMIATCYPGAPQYFRWFKHTGEGNLLRGWRDRGYLSMRADRDTPVVGPGISTIEPVDWDGRGVYDLLLGAEPGTPILVRNEGTRGNPVFATPERLRWTNGEPIELNAIEHGDGSNWGPIESHIERFLPRSADWNENGDPDIITGSMGMRLLWLKGVRGNDGVRFERPRVLKLEGEELEVAHRVQPYLTDWNGNGHLDVIALNPWNRVTAYLGDGTDYLQGEEPLLDVHGKPIQTQDSHRAANSGRTGIALVDWTGDGRRDLLLYSRVLGGCKLYRNAGWPDEDRFEAESELLFEPLAGHNAGVTPFDWNNDGRLEILAGGGPPAILFVVDGQSVSVPYATDTPRDGTP